MEKVPKPSIETAREFKLISPEEEEELLHNAAPFLQDTIRFDLNTRLRSGEIFILPWSNVDFEKNVLYVFAPKTQKTRVVPINVEARKVLEAWALGRRMNSSSTI